MPMLDTQMRMLTQDVKTFSDKSRNSLQGWLAASLKWFYIQTSWKKVHFLSFLPSIYHFRGKDEHWKEKKEEVVFLSFICKSMKQMVGNCKEIGFFEPKLGDLTQQWIIMNDKSSLC